MPARFSLGGLSRSLPQAGLEPAVREMSQVAEDQVLRALQTLRCRVPICRVTVDAATPLRARADAAGPARHPAGHLPKQVQGVRPRRSRCSASQTAAARPAAISAVQRCVRVWTACVEWTACMPRGGVPERACSRGCMRRYGLTRRPRTHTCRVSAPQRTSYERLRCQPGHKYRRCR